MAELPMAMGSSGSPTSPRPDKTTIRLKQLRVRSVAPNSLLAKDGAYCACLLVAERDLTQGAAAAAIKRAASVGALRLVPVSLGDVYEFCNRRIGRLVPESTERLEESIAYVWLDPSRLASSPDELASTPAILKLIRLSDVISALAIRYRVGVSFAKQGALPLQQRLDNSFHLLTRIGLLVGDDEAARKNLSAAEDFHEFSKILLIQKCLGIEDLVGVRAYLQDPSGFLAHAICAGVLARPIVFPNENPAIQLIADALAGWIPGLQSTKPLSYSSDRTLLECSRESLAFLFESWSSICGRSPEELNDRLRAVLQAIEVQPGRRPADKSSGGRGMTDQDCDGSDCAGWKDLIESFYSSNLEPYRGRYVAIREHADTKTAEVLGSGSLSEALKGADSAGCAHPLVIRVSPYEKPTLDLPL